MRKIILLLTILIGINACSKKTYAPFKIGVIADCQYCDCEVKWDRYYKKSPARLKEAVLF